MFIWTPGWEHFYRRILPAYWVFLFLCTHFPRADLPGPRDSDKGVHFAAFGLLAFLYWRCAESIRRPLPGAFVWSAAAALTGYAALDEGLQQYFGRESDWIDWSCDVGGIVGVLGVLEWRRRRSGAGVTRPVGGAQ